MTTTTTDARPGLALGRYDVQKPVYEVRWLGATLASHGSQGAAIEAARAVSGARWPGAEGEYEVVEVLTMTRRVWKGGTK
jgi:hypothetical protein